MNATDKKNRPALASGPDSVCLLMTLCPAAGGCACSARGHQAGGVQVASRLRCLRGRGPGRQLAATSSSHSAATAHGTGRQELHISIDTGRIRIHYCNAVVTVNPPPSGNTARVQSRQSSPTLVQRRWTARNSTSNPGQTQLMTPYS